MKGGERSMARTGAGGDRTAFSSCGCATMNQNPGGTYSTQVSKPDRFVGDNRHAMRPSARRRRGQEGRAGAGGPGAPLAVRQELFLLVGFVDRSAVCPHSGLGAAPHLLALDCSPRSARTEQLGLSLVPDPPAVQVHLPPRASQAQAHRVRPLHGPGYANSTRSCPQPRSPRADRILEDLVEARGVDLRLVAGVELGDFVGAHHLQVRSGLTFRRIGSWAAARAVPSVAACHDQEDGDRMGVGLP